MVGRYQPTLFSLPSQSKYFKSTDHVLPFDIGFTNFHYNMQANHWMLNTRPRSLSEPPYTGCLEIPDLKINKENCRVPSQQSSSSMVKLPCPSPSSGDSAINSPDAKLLTVTTRAAEPISIPEPGSLNSDGNHKDHGLAGTSQTELCEVEVASSISNTNLSWWQPTEENSICHTGLLSPNPQTMQSPGVTSTAEIVRSKVDNSRPIIIDLPPLPTVESTGHLRSIHRPDPTQIFLKSDLRWSSNFVARIFALFVVILVTSTYGYSWNASNPNRRLQFLMWNNPSHTLLTINVMGQVTSAFLGIVLTIACESLRWKMCGGATGVKLLDFMALSGSISGTGLSRILFSSIPSKRKREWISSLKRSLTSRFWSATRSFVHINILELMK